MSVSVEFFRQKLFQLSDNWKKALQNESTFYSQEETVGFSPLPFEVESVASWIWPKVRKAGKHVHTWAVLFWNPDDGDIYQVSDELKCFQAEEGQLVTMHMVNDASDEHELPKNFHIHPYVHSKKAFQEVTECGWMQRMSFATHGKGVAYCATIDTLDKDMMIFLARLPPKEGKETGKLVGQIVFIRNSLDVSNVDHCKKAVRSYLKSIGNARDTYLVKIAMHPSYTHLTRDFLRVVLTNSRFNEKTKGCLVFAQEFPELFLLHSLYSCGFGIGGLGKTERTEHILMMLREAAIYHAHGFLRHDAVHWYSRSPGVIVLKRNTKNVPLRLETEERDIVYTNEEEESQIHQARENNVLDLAINEIKEWHNEALSRNSVVYLCLNTELFRANREKIIEFVKKLKPGGKFTITKTPHMASSSTDTDPTKGSSIHDGNKENYPDNTPRVGSSSTDIDPVKGSIIHFYDDNEDNYSENVERVFFYHVKKHDENIGQDAIIKRIGEEGDGDLHDTLQSIQQVIKDDDEFFQPIGVSPALVERHVTSNPDVQLIVFDWDLTLTVTSGFPPLKEMSEYEWLAVRWDGYMSMYNEDYGHSLDMKQFLKVLCGGPQRFGELKNMFDVLHGNGKTVIILTRNPAPLMIADMCKLFSDDIYVIQEDHKIVRIQSLVTEYNELIDLQSKVNTAADNVNYFETQTTDLLTSIKDGNGDANEHATVARSYANEAKQQVEEELIERILLSDEQYYKKLIETIMTRFGEAKKSAERTDDNAKEVEEIARRAAAEEEARRRAAEEEAQQRAAEEEAQQRAAQEEARRRAEEQRAARRQGQAWQDRLRPRRGRNDDSEEEDDEEEHVRVLRTFNNLSFSKAVGVLRNYLRFYLVKNSIYYQNISRARFRALCVLYDNAQPQQQDSVAILLHGINDNETIAILPYRVVHYRIVFQAPLVVKQGMENFIKVFLWVRFIRRGWDNLTTRIRNRIDDSELNNYGINFFNGGDDMIRLGVEGEIINEEFINTFRTTCMRPVPPQGRQRRGTEFNFCQLSSEPSVMAA